MKQPAWESMPVLDVRALSSAQLSRVAKSYDVLSGENLEPLAQLKSDAVRHRIDCVISDILKLPDLSPIRELLDREPGLTAMEIAPRAVRLSFDAEEDDAEAPL